jgi:hypothetical protein
VAEAFTRDVLRTLERTGRLGDDARIAGAFHDMALPRKAAGVEAGLGRCKHVRAQAIRIGPAIVIGSPEEVVCEVAMNVKRQSPAAETLFASYCPNAVGDPSRMHDSAGGYLPAAAHYEFGGYEVRVSPYSPEAEAVYTREMLALAAKIEKMP